MNHPKISAILPCYNHAAYPEERIKSILGQTFPVSQIIFLDDASTDGSLELARKLLLDSPAEVEFHSNACNSGSPFYQWNKGLRLAKYPHIWIAETDDTCSLDLLAVLCAKMINTGAVIAFSQSRYISENGADLGSPLRYTSPYWPGVFEQDFLVSGKEFNSKYMSSINVIPNASAVLFSRGSCDEELTANETMNFAGDWDFWMRIAQQGRVAFVADELNAFRCHRHTTRQKHHTPQATAEVLACRFRAHSLREGLSDQLHLKGFIQLLRQQTGCNMAKDLSSLAWRDFRQVYVSYTRLNGVPCVSNAVWAIIAMISFNRYFCQEFLNLRGRAVYYARRLFAGS